MYPLKATYKLTIQLGLIQLNYSKHNKHNKHAYQSIINFQFLDENSSFG